jgi:hypothetical protein
MANVPCQARPTQSASVFRLCTAALLVLLASGCALRGPDMMRSSRIAYNQAMQVSDQREQLLNLVYLRYDEAPEFLTVSGISTQMNVEVNASLGAELGEDGGDTTVLASPAVGVGYSESPTVTFIPQRDEAFTRQLVAPVELDSIYLLTRYGWELDRVLTLMVDSINGVSYGTEQYAELVHHLGDLYNRGQISVEVQRRSEDVSPVLGDAVPEVGDILAAAEQGYRFERRGDGYVITGKASHYVLAVDPSAWTAVDAKGVANIMQIPPGSAYYELDPGDGGNSEAIELTTRSVLGAMKYLSSAVDVPPVHENFVRRIDDSPQSMLNIRVSSGPVEDAFLSVEYRGHWYYVADNDVDSKRTLGLLTSLARLTITAGGAENVPVLTLPVAR